MTELPAVAEQNQLELLPPPKPPQPGAVAMLTQHAAAMHTAYELATRLVTTDLVPARYRGKPDDATAAILYGAELGLNPIQALQNVFSVNGSPAIYARTMAALLKARGYTFKTVQRSHDVAEVHGFAPGRDPHTDEPDEQACWTIEDAQRARYTTNKKYETDPRAMLYAKALAEVCRHLAPDILLGISVSVEDMQLDAPPQPPAARASALLTAEDILEPPEQPQPAPDQPAGDLRERRGQDTAVSAASHDLSDPAEAPNADELWPEPPAEDVRMITPAQLRKLSILLKEAGFDDRESRHGFVTAAIGHPITSAKDLTLDEASHVIDTLENNQEPL